MSFDVKVNMLFYSQKCPDCRTLLLLLNNEGFISYFKLICVDTILHQLPPNMIVPTMILVNVKKPLVGIETFEWLKQMKIVKNQQPMSQPVSQPASQNMTTYNNTTEPSGPIGFDSDIMLGISDKFAFTKIDDPLPHSYFSIGDEANNAIYTAPQDTKKLNRDIHTKKIRELELKRSSLDKQLSGHRDDK